MQQEIRAAERMAMANLRLSKTFFLDAAAMTTRLLGQATRSDFLPAMAPFNAPTDLVARAVVIPPTCGNAVVPKSSKFAPRCAEIIVELLYEAGLPKGILSLLHVSREDSPKVAEQIISHELIQHVNVRMLFHQMLSLPTTYLTLCVLELGGKSVVAVDVNLVIVGIIMGAVANGGQVNMNFSYMLNHHQVLPVYACMSTERVIVQRNVPVPPLQTPTAIASTMKAGTEPTCPLAPLATAAAANCVAALLADAEERGGKLLVEDLTAQVPY
ncbi:Aldehyde/histidinol dehydrogenase [Hysterangium stoloniferum]|nr:Aldehyde/histidinol dehydrogenase [Hysterangium stoloniferum]